MSLKSLYYINLTFPIYYNILNIYIVVSGDAAELDKNVMS